MLRLTFPIIVMASALAAGLSSVSPSRLGAQGTITGTLFDSLRTRAPIADAEVVVVGANRKTRTDERGRFSIADVPAGRYTVGYWAPWLDSLSLPPMQKEVQVGDGDRPVQLSLATPSPATYQRAACGTVLADDQGVLVGEIRGPDLVPLPGIGVSARWSETRIGIGQLERLQVASVDSSNAAGLYAVCGVPTETEVSLRAIGSDGVGSNEIVLAITGRFQRRDITVGPRDVHMRIVGRVLRPDGVGLPGATVAVTGDSGQVTTTDTTGRFVLDAVPRRSTQVVARALGFVPQLVAVEPFGGLSELDDVQLEQAPQDLGTVVVEGQRVSPEAFAFEERRASGMGTYLTDRQLAALPIITQNAVSAMIPRSEVLTSGMDRRIMFRKTTITGGSINTHCQPRFYVDGMAFGKLSPEEESMYISLAKRIEAYTAAFASGRFYDPDGCGVIAVWTR